MATAVQILTPEQVLALPPRALEVVVYRKSGLSLNHIQGCPLDLHGGGPLFRKTSCAVSYVHDLPDYNGHVGIRLDYFPSGLMRHLAIAAWELSRHGGGQGRRVHSREPFPCLRACLAAFVLEAV